MKVTNFLQDLHCRFVLCTNGQIYGGNFTKFCGLLILSPLSIKILLHKQYPICQIGICILNTIWRGWTFSSRGWPRGYAWGRCVICISHNLQRRSWWRGQNRICRGCWGRNGSRGRGLIGGCGWGWKREKFDWKVHASMLDLVLFQEDSENFI